MTDRLVWIDCEMTGLDLERDALIEIACLVTDGDLTFLTRVLTWSSSRRPRRSTRCWTWSGRCTPPLGCSRSWPSGVTLAEAQDQVLGYVRGHVAEPRKAPLCGNSIATDRSFIARDMPALDAYLHYRMVDVSSIKELARRWYPRVYFASPPKHGGHRALADITGEHPGAALLPRGGVRATARPGLGERPADRRALRHRHRGRMTRDPRPRRRPNPVRPSDRVPLCFIQPGSRAACAMVGVAQLVRAPGCGPGGRGFESPRPPQRNSRSGGAAG